VFAIVAYVGGVRLVEEFKRRAQNGCDPVSDIATDGAFDD
jgi:hypothetical protein